MGMKFLLLALLANLRVDPYITDAQRSDGIAVTIKAELKAEDQRYREEEEREGYDACDREDYK